MAAKAKRRKDGEPSQPSGRTRAGQTVFRRKSCLLCKHHAQHVDYKDITLLRRYLSERGKIRTRRMTGACRRHQRLVAVAIKRAREMALLPYVTPGGAPPARGRSQSQR